MFGIGGGELIFIMFVVLLLFGSDKVPEMARGMGKMMAQLKNATNDIKNEIQKGVEDNGFDQRTLNDLANNITSEISKAKSNLLGETTTTLSGISGTFASEMSKAKSDLLGETTTTLTEVSTATVTVEIEKTKDVPLTETVPQTDKAVEEIEDSAGSIKRKK
ncbi:MULTISPECIES: Sec-independent protein translocase subunit TatA/TatB [unclassified Flavobacterium]|jgi:sec-independent protein translocase protein TatA|uniref:Sec-independent protein translocase subunit TatA/TatB n=1 Tax=unclassified Flavobacterium TaxID=196869 RepID=UPI0039C86A63